MKLRLHYLSSNQEFPESPDSEKESMSNKTGNILQYSVFWFELI